MYFETKRLIIRDYENSDFDAYYRIKSDAATMYYLQDIQLFSREEAEKDFAKVLSDLENENRKFYFFNMEDKITQEQIGSIGYTVTKCTPIGKNSSYGLFYISPILE